MKYPGEFNLLDQYLSGNRQAGEELYTRLYELVGFGKEPNETKLGLSVEQSRGKGSKPESLYKIFNSVTEQCLVQRGLIASPAELCVFVKNFAEDRMSDLVTNIARKELYEFTVRQCNKHSIELGSSEHLIGQYWNPTTKMWERLVGHPLVANNRIVLLVPKEVVRRNFIISVSQYLQKCVLSHRQQYHLAHRTDMVHTKYNKNQEKRLVPPSKKEVYAKEIKGQDHKQFAREYTEEHPQLLEMFRRQKLIEGDIWEYVLSNSELDYYVYGGKRIA